MSIKVCIMKKTRYLTENWALVEENDKVFMAKVIIHNEHGEAKFEFKQISKCYDEISDFDENGIAVVRNSGIHGFIDECGNEIVKPQYEMMGRIFDKYYWTGNILSSLFRILNKKGEIMCEYEHLYTNGEAKAAIVELSKGRFGIINSECQEIHKREYEELNWCGYFLKGRIGNTLVMINIEGEEVFSIQDARITALIDGYFDVQIGREHGRLNPEMKLIIPIAYEEISVCRNGFFTATIERDRGYQLVQEFDKEGRKIGKEVWVRY